MLEIRIAGKNTKNNSLGPGLALPYMGGVGEYAKQILNHQIQ